MTWEELKKYARTKDASIDTDNIYFRSLVFHKDGSIYYDKDLIQCEDYYDNILEIPCVVTDRTIEQMYNIINLLV